MERVKTKVQEYDHTVKCWSNARYAHRVLFVLSRLNWLSRSPRPRCALTRVPDLSPAANDIVSNRLVRSGRRQEMEVHACMDQG